MLISLHFCFICFYTLHQLYFEAYLVFFFLSFSSCILLQYPQHKNRKGKKKTNSNELWPTQIHTMSFHYTTNVCGSRQEYQAYQQVSNTSAESKIIEMFQWPKVQTSTWLKFWDGTLRELHRNKWLTSVNWSNFIKKCEVKLLLKSETKIIPKKKLLYTVPQKVLLQSFKSCV